MQDIFTTLDHIVRHVTIHYGPGRSVDSTEFKTSRNWTDIERRLNSREYDANIVIDYWQDTAGKEHPRLSGTQWGKFGITPDDNDRLLRATIRPLPNRVRFDSCNHPQRLTLSTSNFELYIKRGDQKWRPSIAAELTIDLLTGRIIVH